MSTSEKSFHRSTPIQRNDGTLPDAERQAERKSLKAIAGAVLQRNATRNDGGTARSEQTGSFRVSQSFHRSTVWEWNDGTVSGEYTPYCCPISPELVTELHRLIAEYAKQYSLADDATNRIIEVAKRQAAASVPASIAFFKEQLARGP